MANLGDFNPADVDPVAPRELLPAGEYAVILIETDLVTKDSGAVQFKFCVQVTEGAYQNRRVYSHENYTKKDGTPNSIGRGMVSQICRCVGVMSPKDTSDLHHKRLVAKVGVGQSDGYDPKNVVKGFKPYEGVAAASPTPTPTTTPGGSASAWAASMGGDDV